METIIVGEDYYITQDGLDIHVRAVSQDSKNGLCVFKPILEAVEYLPAHLKKLVKLELITMSAKRLSDNIKPYK